MTNADMALGPIQKVTLVKMIKAVKKIKMGRAA